MNVEIVHQLAHPVVIAAYLALGGPLCGYVVRQFRVEGRTAIVGARAFFVGCAATHALLWHILVAYDLAGWLHTALDLSCWAQAVGAPVFIRSAWRRWSST